MLEARSLAIRAATLFDEHSHDGHNDSVDVPWRNNNSHITSKSLVSSRAPKRDPEQNLIANLYRLHPDVVRVFHRTDQPTTVVSDVELTRQIVKRAVVDDDL